MQRVVLVPFFLGRHWLNWLKFCMKLSKNYAKISKLPPLFQTLCPGLALPLSDDLKNGDNFRFLGFINGNLKQNARTAIFLGEIILKSTIFKLQKRFKHKNRVELNFQTNNLVKKGRFEPKQPPLGPFVRLCQKQCRPIV